eukprot:gene39348-44059_t
MPTVPARHRCRAGTGAARSTKGSKGADTRGPGGDGRARTVIIQ